MTQPNHVAVHGGDLYKRKYIKMGVGVMRRLKTKTEGSTRCNERLKTKTEGSTKTEG